MNTEEFIRTSRSLIEDLADRLTYMGMHGDERSEYLEIVLMEESLNAYKYVLDITSATGYDRAKHGRDWSGYRLPNPAKLPGISAAVAEFVSRGLAFKERRDGAPPVRPRP